VELLSRSESTSSVLQSSQEPIPHSNHSSSLAIFNQGGVIDWNKKFQSSLDEADQLKKYTALAMLGNDFISVAELYGKIIISGITI